MLKSLRQGVKRIPWVGPASHHIYLTLFCGEGRVETISGGPLKGMKLKRFMRTTAYLKGVFTGDYEQELQRVMMETLRPGQTFYDVGANAGYVTLVGAKLVGPTGKVVAFEPSAATARQLKAQLTLNAITWATVVVKAVSDRVGEARFADDTSADMLGLVDAPRSEPAQRTIVVPTTTLDEVIKTLPQPDVIKIDIEGAEMLALHGATAMLRNVRPVILIELHSPELCQEFQVFIAGHNYSVTTLSGEATVPGKYYRFVIAKPR